jgi:hypothetical protein
MDDEQHYSLAFLVRGLALSERMIRSFLTIFITKNIVRIYFTRLWEEARIMLGQSFSLQDQQSLNYPGTWYQVLRPHVYCQVLVLYGRVTEKLRHDGVIESWCRYSIQYCLPLFIEICTKNVEYHILELY